MASTEHLLVSKVIQTGDMSEILNAGIRPDHFNGEWSDIWLWVINYWNEYQTVPTARAFKQEYGDTKLINTENEPFPALIDELYKEYKQQHIQEAMTEAVTVLKKNDVDEAYKLLSAGLQKASVAVARLRDVDLITSWEARLANYEEMRNTPNALRGMPTGFYGLDRITAGLRPQQLVTFVGEAKKGKSMITLIMANAAHNHGISPLYVSFEMSIEEQAARYDSLISGVAHKNIMHGNLSSAEMLRVEKALKSRRNMHEFYMTEDTSSLTTVSALAGKVQQHRPGLLIVDGVYLMDDENGEPKGSPQALTNITRSLKRMAQRFQIPIICTTQVLAWKLGNKKSRQVTSDSIGYSSSFVQDSDLVLGVESDPDIDNQSIIRVILARSAPKGEVRIKWDWEHMDFTEIDEDTEANDDSGSDNWYY
jgi:replicative DNA helicase